MNIVQLQDLVIKNMRACYNTEQAKLSNLAKNANTEGEIRVAAGKLIEAVLQNIFNTINSQFPTFDIKSKVGSTDFLTKTIHYKGKTINFNSIQVDRHIWSDGERIAFIENKTYLDSCYFDRALADFRKIAYALRQHGVDPASVEYVVFAGQDAASADTLFTYEADFWEDTKHLTKDPAGIEPKIYFFLKGKRSSAKPLYKVKHDIDDDVVRKFVSFIVGVIRTRRSL